MANPSIEELQNSEKYELIDELHHDQIKEFVIQQLTTGGWLVKSFMLYQILMLVLGAFLITQSVILAFGNNLFPLYWTLAAVFFCISLLIIIHELLHGAAIKVAGAPKVNYGAYFRKFIFYAEADRYVLNKKQFAFIALTPFVVVKTVTVGACLLLFQHHALYFFATVMCAHSFFCAGDIGLLSLFLKYKQEEVYTYDLCDVKKSFYYKKKS